MWCRHLWELYWFLRILEIAYTGTYLTHRWLILEVFVIFEACLFWEDVFILGHSHLIDFDIETWPSVYDCYFRWIIEIMIFFRSIFLTYLVWFGYPLTYVTHPYILHLAPLYLYPSCQSLTSFEPTYFIILHDFIPFSLLKEDTD